MNIVYFAKSIFLGMKVKNKKWEEIRKKGKRYYIFKYGILSWGVGTTISVLLLMQVYNMFFEEPAGFVSVFSRDFFLFAPIYLITFMIGGFFWGLNTWSMYEEEWKKQQEYDDYWGTDKSSN